MRGGPERSKGAGRPSSSRLLRWSGPRAGVLADLGVSLVLPRSSPLGVPSADDRLEAILTSYGVDVLRSAQVTAVGDRRLTVSTPDGDRELDDLAYAHVVPHYRAPAWIAESGLAGATGLVDIDPGTLQHPTPRLHLGDRCRGRRRHPTLGRCPAHAGRRPGPQIDQGGGRTAKAVRRLHGHAHHDVAAPADLLPQDPAQEDVTRWVSRPWA